MHAYFTDGKMLEIETYDWPNVCGASDLLASTATVDASAFVGGASQHSSKYDCQSLIDIGIHSETNKQRRVTRMLFDGA